jgi:1,4-dihydroxy-2-naphthoate octaprenyltransferase
MHVLEKPESGVAFPPEKPAAVSSNFWRGVLRLADPRLALASLSVMALGAGAAWRSGGVDWFWLAITVAGVLCIEAAKNAAGEVFDLDAGVDLAHLPEDRSPFAGGRRVLVDGLLTPAQTWLVAVQGFLLGVTAGVWIVLQHEPRVLWIGLAGLALAFFYHAPPVRLSYRGLGETAVGFAYGPMMCAGVYVVQHGGVPLWVMALGVPLGLLIAAFQWVNEFPEFDEDRAAHKNTMVVRLGRPRAARVFAGLMAMALAVTLALPLAGVPLGAWVGLIAIVPAGQAARQLLANPEDAAHVGPAQQNAQRAFLLFAVGAALGVALT